MAEKKDEEKRTYVRADLATRVGVQPVSREEFEQHKVILPEGIPGIAPTDEGDLSDNRLGYLAERINRIEEKLDQLLKKLDPDASPGKMISYGTAQDVSGAGIKLILEDAFQEGQLVLISVSVPGFSIGFLRAYGEVVRVTAVKTKDRQLYETSIKFLIISEDEREKLIAYSFYRQRQVIRKSALARETDQDLLSNE